MQLMLLMKLKGKQRMAKLPLMKDQSLIAKKTKLNSENIMKPVTESRTFTENNMKSKQLNTISKLGQTLRAKPELGWVFGKQWKC